MVSIFALTKKGAGTVLEALKKKMKIIAVNNENMMHQHQRELLDELKESGYIYGLDSWRDVTPETVRIFRSNQKLHLALRDSRETQRH